MAITPDGSHVYVAANNPVPDFGSCDCYVAVIDTSSEKVVAAIPLAYPMALAVSPDCAPAPSRSDSAHRSLNREGLVPYAGALRDPWQHAPQGRQVP